MYVHLQIHTDLNINNCVKTLFQLRLCAQQPISTWTIRYGFTVF